VTATPVEAAPRLAGRCLHAQTQVLENAGHWVQYEAADQVNQLLTAWFSQPESRAGS
jgi:2-hydroxy-6-oxonona-2,4-dienedioate hydrolase